MASYYVTAERDKSMSTPSRDEELIPLPTGKWFDTLKAAFEWAETGNLIGSFLGWEKHIYMHTPKKLVRITKVTEQMIYEDELQKAMEGLRSSYYDAVVPAEIDIGPLYHDTDEFTFQIAERGYGRKKWEEMTKAKLNSVYGETAGDRHGKK